MQAFRSPFIFRLFLVIICLRLRQSNLQTPQIPPQPNSHGDCPDHGSHAHHVRPHDTILPGRSPRIRQNVRHLRRGALSLLQRSAVPSIPAFYRFLYLLDPPRSAPPLDLQETTQATSQMDHAHSLCFSCLPPRRWLVAECPLPRLSLHLPSAEMGLRRALRVHQFLDHYDPRR